MPNRYLKQTEKAIINFIWNGKKPRISMKILQSPYDCGGAKLVNLRNKEMSLRVSWIKVINNDSEIAALAYNALIPQLGEDIWRCNLQPKDLTVLKITPSFWRDVLYSWCQYNYQDNIQEPTTQFVWLNSNICIAKKPVFWKQAYANGLRQLHQLVIGGGFITQHMAKEQFGQLCSITA